MSNSTITMLIVSQIDFAYVEEHWDAEISDHAELFLVIESMFISM
jgi:hypothetical protein